MTTLRITLSQAVVDLEHALEASSPVLTRDPGSLLGFFNSSMDSIEQDEAVLASWELAGPTLRMTYTGGAVETYGGVALDNPSAERGHASASNYSFYQPGLVSVNVAGRFDYDYVLSGGTLSIVPSAQGVTMHNMRITTLLPASSPDYDPQLGNVSLSIDGAITTLPSGATHGSITRIAATADKLIQSSLIEGSFQMSVNPLDPIVSWLEGTLTAYRTVYRDGSVVDLSNASVFVQTEEGVDELLYRGSPGRDDFSLDLPGRLYSDVIVAAAEGDDLVSVKGGGGRVSVVAGDGNDVVTLLGDKVVVDGGRGMDIVKLGAARSDFAVKAVSVPHNPDPRYTPLEAYTLTDKSGAASSLVNVERIVFSDATLALDIQGNAGQTYRLYQAAFNRTPDAGGLGYWINAMDKGANLVDVAASFLAEPEGVKTYGGNLSNLEMVTRFYQNILHRDPDIGGRDYWTGLIDQNKATVAQVLAGISESNENKIGLVGVIGNGFTFTPYEQG